MRDFESYAYRELYIYSYFIEVIIVNMSKKNKGSKKSNVDKTDDGWDELNSLIAENQKNPPAPLTKATEVNNKPAPVVTKQAETEADGDGEDEDDGVASNVTSKDKKKKKKKEKKDDSATESNKPAPPLSAAGKAILLRKQQQAEEEARIKALREAEEKRIREEEEREEAARLAILMEKERKKVILKL